MKRVMLTAALALGLAAPAQAVMTLGEFLAKANKLQARGALAMFSSDLRPVMNEMKLVSAQMKAEAEQRRIAGLPKRACPPEGTALPSKELLSMLNGIPSAERGISVKEGMVRVMAKRFPCR
jgi:hypothetical protein